MILIVDDDPDVLYTVEAILKKEGYDVEKANGGSEALEHLKTSTPELILLDVMMPDIDGWGVLKEIRNDERLKDIPIIMITSRTGQKHRDRANKIGVNVYLGKPFGEEELLNNIQSLLEQRH